MMLDLYHAQIGEGNLDRAGAPLRRCDRRDPGCRRARPLRAGNRRDQLPGDREGAARHRVCRHRRHGGVGVGDSVAALEAFRARSPSPSRRKSHDYRRFATLRLLASEVSGPRGWCRSSSATRDSSACRTRLRCRIVERRAGHGQQRRAGLLVEQPGLGPGRPPRTDALARQPDVHTPRPQRLIQPVALEFLGIGRDFDGQLVDHHRERLAVGAAQPMDRHHLAVVSEAELARDLFVGRADVVVEQLRGRLLAGPREISNRLVTRPVGARDSAPPGSRPRACVPAGPCRRVPGSRAWWSDATTSTALPAPVRSRSDRRARVRRRGSRPRSPGRADSREGQGWTCRAPPSGARRLRSRAGPKEQLHPNIV